MPNMKCLSLTVQTSVVTVTVFVYIGQNHGQGHYVETFCIIINNGNNLMMYASKLKVDSGIPCEPVLHLSGKYNML